MKFFILCLIYVAVRCQISARLSRSRTGSQPYPSHHTGNEQGLAESGASLQNWRDLISVANNGSGVSDVNDFLRLLVTNDGRQVTENDIFSPYETVDGKRVITGGGVMATSDECSPRNVSVRLPLNYSDSQVAYYPECTMVQRCGGCTPTPYLSCEPLYKEKIVLKVLRAVYLYPGALHMQWTGFESVEVERHLSCRPVCVLKGSDCGPLKQFIQFQCKCQCRRFDRCSNEQKWDDNTCSCKCRNEQQCCEEGTEPCTSFFDHRTCRCSLKQSIGAPVSATQQEIDQWMASRGQAEYGYGATGTGQLAQSFPAPGPTTTAALAPTPEPSPAPEPACAALPCPSGFYRRMNMGRCVCVLRVTGRRNPHQG